MISHTDKFYRIVSVTIASVAVTVTVTVTMHEVLCSKVTKVK